MPLKILVKEQNNAIVTVALEGSIDSATCPDLEKRINEVLQKSPNGIVFDFGQVTYITSIGLTLMVKTEKAIKEAGKTLIVINIPAQVKKVFDVIASLPAINIFKNRQEADDYLLRLQKGVLKKQKPSN